MSAGEFIESIFNYCDRWCERCELTSRCRLFARERSELRAAEALDLANANFWRSLERTFEGILETLTQEAEKRGIVLDAESIADEDRRTEDRFAEAQAHPLVRRAEAYGRRVEEWLTGNEPLIAQALDRLDLAERLDPGQSGSEVESKRLGEAVEVVRWYQFQIQTKLVRTLAADDLASERLDPASDTNGSAKVALIGMDRSVAAWGVLYGLLPVEEDSILDVLLHLDRLRKLTEREFPGARSFVRPGFDTRE